MSGPSDLQGPHQGAQKSTRTGTCSDRASTSVAKLPADTSAMKADSDIFLREFLTNSAQEEFRFLGFLVYIDRFANSCFFGFGRYGV